MKIFKLILICTAAWLYIIAVSSEGENLNLSDSFNSGSEKIWATDPGSFVELPLGENLDPSKVTIIIPENCGKKNALRGKYLADRLTSLEIPVSLQSHFSVVLTNNSEERQRISYVRSGNIPIVFVGNKGKPNPRLKEILYEYYLINP